MRIISSKFYCSMGLLASMLFWIGCIVPKKGPRTALRNAGPKLPFDVVIIPGIPYNGTNWDSVMKARVLWSYILYKNGYASNIIYSGGAIYTPYKEGIVMSMFGEKLGIPREHIFADTQARHSTENIYYSYLLAKKLGFKTVALGTDPFQSFMLRGFTRRRFGTPIYHIPFVTDSLRAYNTVNITVDAQSAKMDNWQSIKEKQNFSTRLRGTLGRGIDWGKYADGRVGPL